MNPQAFSMSDLVYPRLWWALGGLWLLIIVYASVADLSLPQIDSQWGDKANHLLAYGFLMGWFGQLLKSSRHWLFTAVALVLMGVLMEIIQGTLPHRWFDVKDAVANTVGVLLALLVLYAGGNQILRRFEKMASRS